LVMSPLVYVLEKITDCLMRLVGFSPDKRDSITSEDILASVGAGAAAGVIERSEQAVIENVFELDNRTLPTAMTAREYVVFFTLEDSIDDIKAKLERSPHTSYLVCDTELNNVLGAVDSKDLVVRFLSNKAIDLKDPTLLHPVQFVPDTLTLSEILKIFQRARSDFAVVLNEYALVVGIITINDVMATVMGDLVITPEESQIVRRDEDSWLVEGVTPTVDLEHVLDLDELVDDTAYETVAGFMMHKMRKIPKLADRFEWRGYRFEVMAVEQHKVDKVLVTRVTGAKKAAKPAAPAAKAEAPRPEAAKPA
ncbi:MAG: HlyC/CorC family transporter, partial [Duodenibacillus sp.]|nr:HlyC/CorC family transporter [Duodenibacillus sp.]